MTDKPTDNDDAKEYPWSDIVDETSDASFPASDPPGWSPLRVGRPDESLGRDDVVIDPAIARRTIANPTG